MDYMQEYRSKLTTPEEAVKLVKSGDWIDYSTNLAFPVLLDRALAKRKDELFDVKIRGYCFEGPIEVAECDPEKEHFIYNSWFCLPYERKLSDRGLCSFTPMLFRYLPKYYREYLTVNVAMMAVTPMDDHGYFNFSVNSSSARATMDAADIIILEVDENLPRVLGLQESIHISEVDAVVEGEHERHTLEPSPAPTEVDMKIAELVVSNMTDGACIQLGAGSMPDVIGNLIADSDLKDLGIHTELLAKSYLEMHRAGKITNRNKHGLFQGKSLFGFSYLDDEIFEWVNENPSVLTAPIDYINSVDVLRSIDNFVSINNCISVDLYGQVSAESVGSRQISGTGGQLDFINGGFDNPTGTSFLCFSSTFTDKKGGVHSRIVPNFTDIVTDPRSQTYKLVTEYGIEDLTGRTAWERTEKLIGLAHPDFRDELIRSAEEMNIWRRSNKR